HLADFRVWRLDPGLGWTVTDQTRFAAVFFDAAGTLIETREPVGRTYTRFARRHGLHADEADVAEGFRRSFASAPSLAFGLIESADELRRLERGWWRRVVELVFAGLGRFDDFDRFFE